MLFRHVYSIAFLMVLLWAFPGGSRAGETQVVKPLPTAGELEELIRAAQGQLAQIDSQTAALADEEKGLMVQARDAQREQYEVRKRILESDEESQKMVQRIETMQRDLRDLQEALAQRMAERPDYAAPIARQTAAIERTDAIQKETMELANDRVRIQLELQALEKQRAGMAGDAAPEIEGAGTPRSAEEPDQL